MDGSRLCYRFGNKPKLIFTPMKKTEHEICFNRLLFFSIFSRKKEKLILKILFYQSLYDVLLFQFRHKKYKRVRHAARSFLQGLGFRIHIQ